ncbi:MAG: DUF2815 family protein [Patescibacteria group bacterium]|nr:DUF2815 family protein [Patescibacteria group bacterium]
MSSKGQSYVFQERARAPFLTVVTPQKVNNKGEPKFGATILLTPGSVDKKGIEAALVAVAKEAFPGRDLKTLKFPVESGDLMAEWSAAKKKDGSFFRGHTVFKASSNEENPPVLSVLEGKNIRELLGAQREAEGRKLFYNGCYVLLAVYFKAYKSKQDDPKDGVGEFSGVKAYLNQVLWVADGPRIGGAPSAEIFKGYAGSVTAEDPYTGADDSPF